MRVYHIGPPKTGTTSFQHALGNNPKFIGIKQPRHLRQNIAYRVVTDHLRHGMELAPESLPNDFIYSEEMVLWNTHPGHIDQVLSRLSALLRPQDKVIISTRDLREVLFSWYCERFEDFYPIDFCSTALSHPSFEAYDWTSLNLLLSRVPKSQVEVLDFKDLLLGKSTTLIKQNITLEKVSDHNRKHKGDSVLVSFKNPTAVHLLSFADTAFYKAFPSKNNRSRFSSSRIIQPLVPLKTFQIRRPSETELLEVIQGRFSNGLAYLKNEFGIEYHALQQP